MLMLSELATINDQTSADRLRELANLVRQEIPYSYYTSPAFTPDYQTRIHPICVALSQHPNSPPDVLIELFGICPIEVLIHPLLNLFLFETPDLLEQMFFSHQYVFDTPGLPKFFLDWARNHSDFNIRLALLKSPQTSCRYLPSILEDEIHPICAALSQQPNSPPYELMELFGVCPIEVLSHPLLDLFLFKTPELLNHLYSSCKGVFDTPGLPRKFLDWARNHSDFNIRLALVESPQTPYRYLLSMVEDEQPAIRFWMARNLSKSSQKRAAPDHPALVALLKRLARDKNYSVRMMIARFESLSPLMLTELELAQNTGQRTANDTILIEILEMLAIDKDSRVRHCVAQNPKTPIHILEKMASDKHQNVGVSIAMNPNTPAEALAKMAKHKYKNVILSVAKHRSTPIETLQILIRGRDEKIAKLAIKNLQNRT